MKRSYLFLMAIIVVFTASYGFVSTKKEPKSQSFKYYQDYSSINTPSIGMAVLYPLHFDDVREECKLSSWKKPNWQIDDNGVRVVGSRISEWKRREESVKKTYPDGISFVTLRGYRVPWFTLSMGDYSWKDYTLETTIQTDQQKTADEYTTAGVAFRYQNPRQYYSFMLEKTNKASLYFRSHTKEAEADHEAWIELESVPFNYVPGGKYFVKVKVEGDKIECHVNNKLLITCKDHKLTYGKIALLADNPVLFGTVKVEGKLRKKDYPPLPVCAKPKLVATVNLPETKGERRFFFYDIDSDGEQEIIVAESNEQSFGDMPPGKFDNMYRCLEFDGTELWKITGIKYPLGFENGPIINCFDINGDGKNEIIVPIDFQIQVRDGKSGKLLKSVDAPNPNPYLGEKKYPYKKVLVDALWPLKLNPDNPPGFYVKDDYTNIWVYDHNLSLKWHKAINTGHWPMPVDINNDGSDEILVSHSLLDNNGNILWELPLSDHADRFRYLSLNPGKKPMQFYLAHGEMGLLEIDPKSGKLLFRGEYGHVQTESIGNFLPEKSGDEIVISTSWREGRIYYLFDSNLELISFWESDGINYPLPWGMNGRCLVLTQAGILNPITGSVIVPSFGNLINVLDRGLAIIDDSRWGKSLVVTYDNDKLNLYKPEW